MSADYLLIQTTFSPYLIKPKFHFTLNQYNNAVMHQKIKLKYKMKITTKQLVFLLFTISLLFVLQINILASVKANSSYFPLQIGNSWTFLRNGTLVTEHIIDTVRIKENLYFKFDSLAGSANVLIRSDGAKYYRYGNAGDVLWYDFAADSGALWQILRDTIPIPITAQMSVRGINESITVPAGVYSNCRWFSCFYGMDAELWEWFAPGVGIVKRGLVTFPPGVSWELVSAIITNVDNDETIPVSYNLGQNYPNPFNPTTIINYSIPNQSFVSIKVYDVMGREIKTLVNGEKIPGNYKVEFNANKLTSGIYFYRIQVGSFVQTKKSILIK